MTADRPAHSEGLFVADSEHVRWLGDRILQAVAAQPPARVLDIGCGDGALIAYLAAGLPASTFVGIDLSPANVDHARRRIETAGLTERVTLQQGDYLALRAGRFDLVVAASTLQGIDATTPDLAAKLASDTAPNGLLVHLTPYRCAYNTVLNVIRRALTLVRGPAGDRIILTAARALHPNQPVDHLAQRVPYMYLVLRHHEDGLRAELEGHHGFTCTHQEAAPHSSVGQPRHRLAILSAPRE